MNDEEEWRAIEDHEGSYEVSNHGRVRSVPRKDSAGRQRLGQILSPAIDKRKGYKRVGLSKDGVISMNLVHILVTRGFIGNCPEGFETAHKDHNPGNNHIDNLEYVTHADNMKQSASIARMGKLSMSDVQDIREIFAENPQTRVTEIARILDTTPETIANIVRCKRYIHVPKRDGTPAEPVVFNRTLTVAKILELRTQGLSIPQIAKMYGVEYSTPYQALRRAGIHQPGNHAGGRLSAKEKAARASIEGLPLFLK